VGGACGMHVERKEMCTVFWWERPKERDQFKDRVVDGRMESELVIGRLAGGVEWIQFPQDRTGGGLL